jgi:hypothetical protein
VPLLCGEARGASHRNDEEVGLRACGQQTHLLIIPKSAAGAQNNWNEEKRKRKPQCA